MGPSGNGKASRIIDCPGCGFEHYWCDTCQRAICNHLEVPGAPVETKSATDPLLLERLQAFVAWVLAGLSAEAHLRELTKTPEQQYALRIEISGEVPKPLAVSACLIETAVAQPLSFRALRAILQAHVLRMKQTQLMSDAREMWAERHSPPFTHRA